MSFFKKNKMVTYQTTKTLNVRPNNNSADCISPNYIYVCLGCCMKNYCYEDRYNPNQVFVNTNVDDIEKSILQWVDSKSYPKIPNQQDPIYYLVDIGCSSDLSLHQKHLNKIGGLKRILKFYDNHPKLKSTFATKYSSMLNLDVTDFNKKPRVRISLMPESYSKVLEPKTTPILERILDIDRLQDLGWEVHLNFSPIVVIDKEAYKYKELFIAIDKLVTNKKEVKCECIFLTNHSNNMTNASIEAKNLMKYSSEIKNSTGVMRYPISKKGIYVKNFKKLLHKYLSWCEIRYIF